MDGEKFMENLEMDEVSEVSSKWKVPSLCGKPHMVHVYDLIKENGGLSMGFMAILSPAELVMHLELHQVGHPKMA